MKWLVLSIAVALIVLGVLLCALLPLGVAAWGIVPCALGVLGIAYWDVIR